MNIPLIDLACPPLEPLQHLNVYHYGATALVGVIFLLFFVLAIMLRKKTVISAILFLFSFLLSGPAIIATNVFVEEHVRQVNITEFRVKRLLFLKAFVVTGNIKNSGKFDIKKTFVKVKFVKKGDSWWREAINFYKPVDEQTFILDTPLKNGEVTDFKVLADTTKLKNPDSLLIYTVYKAF